MQAVIYARIGLGFPGANIQAIDLAGSKLGAWHALEAYAARSVPVAPWPARSSFSSASHLTTASSFSAK